MQAEAQRIGERVAESVSLGWVQSASNLGRVALCARCGSVIGTPAELLAAAAAIEPPPEVLMGMRCPTPPPRPADSSGGDGDGGHLAAAATATTPATSAPAGAAQPPVQCKLGCGQVYCNPACEAEDRVEGVHAQLCAG